MDILDFLRSASPLALAGVAFAVVNQAFKWTWRIAQVEERSTANAHEIARVEEESTGRYDELVECLKPLPRIETIVNQLADDRRHGR